MPVSKFRKCPTCIGLGVCADGESCPTCDGAGEVPAHQTVTEEPCYLAALPE